MLALRSRAAIAAHHGVEIDARSGGFATAIVTPLRLRSGKRFDQRLVKPDAVLLVLQQCVKKRGEFGMPSIAPKHVADAGVAAGVRSQRAQGATGYAGFAQVELESGAAGTPPEHGKSNFRTAQPFILRNIVSGAQGLLEFLDAGARQQSHPALTGCLVAGVIVVFRVTEHEA